MASTSEQTSDTADSRRGYSDLRDHMEALRKADLLVEIDREINKDTEMHPLVRWQFRGGIAEEDRKAFLFTNITDAKGRKFDLPALLCGIAGSRQIYSLGIGCPPDRIHETWIKAMEKPVPPKRVETAPCQEIMFQGDELVNGYGLDALPLPISTPGFDCAPYTTAGHWITKDPETGIQNMGNYRGMLKAPDRIGMNPVPGIRAGGARHFEKWKARRKRMPAAIVIGPPPAVSYAAATKMAEGLDELGVAGGLIGAPINVVPAKTVDLLVPAEAEIVIEGFIDTECLEPEAPFGEFHGYVALTRYNPYLEVTAITRKRDALYSSWVSQVAPSESSVIKRPGYEAVLIRHLRDHLGIKDVVRVITPEPLTCLQKLMVIQFRKGVPETEVWRALYGVASLPLNEADGKWVIAVDEDIDGDDPHAVFWAMSYRCKPHRDVQIILNQGEGSGPRSAVEPADSAVLVNAMLSEPFPPVSLPRREYMEQARQIWEELGLPPLRPESPWHGYELGQWNEILEHQARLAVSGEYWQTGQWCAQHRRTDVALGTEMNVLDENIRVGEPGSG